ncbi:MAG: TrkA family potassium uptake protein [Caldilineaceae bacterium]|nr:TrkA family potassium uptake protein [Caldilineaceae bacterium]
MRAILVGCGRAGAELAARLAAAGHAVTVIDIAAAAFDNLPADFRGHVIQAEALNQDVLVNAGVEEAGSLAALTNSDALNAVVGHIAKTVYHVPRVVVRTYDPRWSPVHAAFELESVSSVQWNASRFEELMVHPDLVTLQPLGDGGIALYELAVPAAWAGRRLGELAEEPEVMVAGVTRGDVSLMPAADWVLEAGDRVALSTTAAGAARLRTQLNQGA